MGGVAAWWHTSRMSDSTSSSAPVARRRLGCLGLAMVLVVTVMVAGGFVAWRLVNQGWGWKWLAGLFQKQTLTEAFHESIRRVLSTNGDVLELATLESEETVTRFDSKTLFDVVYLGTTESEIRARVVYRYHLKLSDPWQISVRDGRCVVLAPAIRPSLPPAIRTETMEKKSAAGWLRFNSAENLAELEKGLTGLLERRAAAPGKINHVREAARLSVAKFVQAWMLREQSHLPLSGLRGIVVIFPDEPAAANVNAAQLLPETLRFDSPAD